MMSLRDFIIDFSKEYSVHRLDDVKSGTFIRVVKGDVYLMYNATVKDDEVQVGFGINNRPRNRRSIGRC